MPLFILFSLSVHYVESREMTVTFGRIEIRGWSYAYQVTQSKDKIFLLKTRVNGIEFSRVSLELCRLLLSFSI